MPNHVTTRCIVTGSATDIERFRSTMIRVPEGITEPTLDFDLIIPMPKVIKDTDGNVDLGIEVLTGNPRPGIYSTSYLTVPWIEKLGIKTISELRAWAEKERPEALVSGRKALDAFRETGFYDWYDWSVANWGTKWNSYSFDIENEDDDQFSFHFDTAWSFPIPIFERLAKMFPTLRFDCACFDEMWNFAGEGAFNGNPPFDIVEPTDELYELVYGEKPESESENGLAVVTSTATEPEADTIAGGLMKLERCMTSLVSTILGSELRAARESTEWRTNEALQDLDRALNRGVEDFLLGPELDKALLSLEGRAKSPKYRYWLASYRKAEKQFDAQYPSQVEIPG